MILPGADNRPPMLDKDLVAKDLWERVQLLMQGTSLTNQERESKLLPPEWSKFMTDVKLVNHLHTTNFEQLHTYRKQHELVANEVCLMRERNQDLLALGDDPIACLNKEMAFLIVVASSRFPLTNKQLRTSSNPRNQATIQDDRVTVQQVQVRQWQSYSGTGSLPFEWNTNVVVWRNKHDLDTMSIDDLYNNFKIVEQEVKGTASSNSSSQNKAFMSSPSTNSTNEVYNPYEVSTASTQSSTASTQVSTANSQTSTANLSDATIYAFLANQQMAGADKSKVECYNCHKMRHVARECRGLRNQDSRNMYQDSSRRTVNVEETPPKAMVAIDGVGFDWSFMADDEVPTNMALMAFSDSETLELGLVYLFETAILNTMDLEVTCLNW
nr:hypothetical protein [Tanacetum cinerariifolium]